MADEQLEVHEATARRRRSSEAPASPATAAQAKQESRNPDWPAQYDTDGWDQVPVQMRP
jgi:hypothetical protein